MFLSSKELEQLTGYKLAAYQRRWLERERIRYRVNGRGQVIVAQADVLGIRPQSTQQHTPKRFSFEHA